MTGMHALWIPIVVSAVFVFVASSVLHMVMPGWHASDYGKLPNRTVSWMRSARSTFRRATM